MEPEFYSKFDLENLITPVNIQAYERLLYEVNYDPKEINFLVDGFKNGFDLGYRGDPNIKKTSPNLKLCVGSETVLWNKIMKEVKKLRYAGPYEGIPFDSYIQSPVGLVPKDGGKDTRLIFHLSYPKKGDSVNSQMSKKLMSVSYCDFMDAV